MSDIYRIAVRLTMESNAAGVLSALSQQLLHVHAHVRQLEGGLRSLDRVKLAVFGGLGIAAGAGLLGMLKSTIDASKDLNRQLTNTRTLVADPVKSAALAAQALGVARDTARSVRGVPLDKAVELYADSYSIMGAANAKKVNAMLARYAMVAGGASGDYERSFENLRELIKSGELSGQILDKKSHEINTDRLLGYLDLAAKASAATDNRINARTFFQIAQQGGTALNNMSPDGIMAVLMAAQDMGGFRAGTATMSAFSQFVGGVMTQPKAKRLHELGLVGDYSVERGGHLVFKKGALDTDFTKAMRHDPLQAIKLLRDALTKHGITGEKQSEEMFKILGRQTVQRLFSDWLNGFQQKLDERGRIMGAQGLKQQDATRNDNDYARNLHNLEIAIGNFKAEVGNSMTPAAIDILKKMTDGVRYLNDQVVKMGPEKVGAIGKGIAILGAALVGGGAVALIAALGPAGWLAAGIIALGAAVATIKPNEFKQAIDGATMFYGSLGSGDWKKALSGYLDYWKGVIKLVLPMSDKLAWALGELAKEIESWPAKLGSAIKRMGEDLVLLITQQLTSIIQGIRSYMPSWLKRTSLEGGAGNGGMLWNASFGGADPSSAKVVAGTIAGGINNSNVVIMGGGGGFGGGGGGGRGGHWGGGMMPIGSGTGPGHVASQADRAAFIRAYAAKIGIDPNTALRVAQSEGFFKYTGDGGRSFGDWQLFTGGGLGNIALNHGLNIRDPRTWKQQTIFALNWAREHGWGDWHGAAHVGIGRFQGIGRPPATPRSSKPVHVHTNVHLDGKAVARVVTKHQVAEMRHAGGLGTFDDHGMRIAGGQTMHSV